MLNRLREWWEGLGRNNQFILAGSSLGGLIALIGFIAWASTPEYTTLFSNLSAPDADAIVNKLKEANVPYRTAKTGTVIEVPSQYKDEMTMKLMAQGLPKEGTATLGGNDGYSLMEKQSLGDSSEKEKMTMQRAREGEIGKMISTMEAVGGATVRFAPADNSPFAATHSDASASVMLTLKPGQSLTEENTRAIVRLVQKFYTGLAEKNITVADARGELLFDGTQSGANNGTDRRKLELAMARDKRTELQGALDRTLGPGKSIVMVNVELDDGTEAKRKTEYEAGAVVSTTTTKEELDGKGNVKSGGGAPGAAPNIGANNLPLAGGAAPGTPGYAASTDANGRYNNESGSKVYQPSTTETTTTKGSNTIKKMTVSAMVDQKVQTDQIAAVTSVLRTAIAYDANDPNRSREVTVQQIPFDRSAEEAETKAANAAKSAENTARMMSVLVPLGLMVLCLFLLARALKKPRMAIGGGQLALPGGGSVAYTIDEKGQVVLEPEGSMSGMSGPGSALTGALTEDGDVLGLSGGSGPKTFEVIEEAFDANLESIVHLAKSKPETVAMLIKGWLSEETVG